MRTAVLSCLVEETARRILDSQPDHVVRYRLLRDVLRKPATDPDVVAARDAVQRSRWVRELAEEQREDGSWGRFHSADSQAHRKIGTTEGGVARAIAVGLGAQHPILRRAIKYISLVLQGKVRIPDRAEKNDRWAAGVRMFAAATIAQVQPDLPILDSVWKRWADVLCRVFCNGEFSVEAEIQAHRDLHGIRDGVAYLGLRNRYAVGLLGSRADQLAPKIERSYVRWLWNLPTGLGYMDAPLSPRPRALTGHGICGWLGSMQMLSGFPSWRAFAEDAIAWLWNQRNEEGVWDFGAKTGGLRFSESWRGQRRSHDHSLVPLIVLRRYVEAG